MPLRDHFHGPLSEDCPPRSFHLNWATKFVDRLNSERLSDKYKAQSGRCVEMEVDLFEVKIYRGSGGWNLVAAIELVSESNKDRLESRRAFVVKCGSYLQQGISLVVVDTVTSLAANLHDELCEIVDPIGAMRWSSPTGLSVIAYRATRIADEGGTRLDLWPHSLALRQPLPTIPLWLNHDLAVPLELEATYEAACRSLRIA